MKIGKSKIARRTMFHGNLGSFAGEPDGESHYQDTDIQRPRQEPDSEYRLPKWQGVSPVNHAQDARATSNQTSTVHGVALTLLSEESTMYGLRLSPAARQTLHNRVSDKTAVPENL